MKKNMIRHPYLFGQAVSTVEHQTENALWSELPSLAVEKVYSFLSRSDQISMSLVCRNWHKEYSSPSLWRKMSVRFPHVDHLTGMYRDVIFARRFGAMFHHVKIVFQEMPSLFCSPVEHSTVKQLQLFFEALTSQSQLLSISFKDLGPYLMLKYYADFESIADVYQLIINFLKSQKELQTLKIDVAGYENEERIMKAVFLNSYKTLRCLCMPMSAYFSEHIDESTEITLDDGINFNLFMNLKVLEMDYNKMFEKMILSFYEYGNGVDMRRRKGRLREMTLYGTDVVEVNVIHPHVWEYFGKIFPDLKIDLHIDCLYGSISLSKDFIVPDMPVRTLNCQLYNDPDTDNEVGLLLRHITSCHINKSLEDLTICLLFTGATPNLASDLMNFTIVSPELKTLELEIRHPVVGLDTLFNCWLENRPMSLHNVKVKILLPHQFTEEEMIYTSLNDSYAPLLQPLEIDLSVEPYYEMQLW